MAAALVTKVVDAETRLHSNVRGKSKKDLLDLRIISYIKRKCFELHQVSLHWHGGHVLVYACVAMPLA